MSNEEFSNILAEAYDHLWHGRYRLGLTAAQKAFDENSGDYNAAICLAWALLENGEPGKALELANLAVEMSSGNMNSKLYRGFLLSRMSIFEGAMADLDSAIAEQQNLLIWTHLNKARSLAGLSRYFEALEEIENAILLDKGKSPNLKELKRWYKIAAGFTKDLSKEKSENNINILDEGEKALKQKEYWFSLLAARKILDNPRLRKEHKPAMLLELESLVGMFQFRPALEKAEGLKEIFQNDNKFNSIYNSIQKHTKKDIAECEIVNIEKRIDFVNVPGASFEFLDVRTFEAMSDQNSDERKYIIQFDGNIVRFIGAEIIFENPAYRKRDSKLNGNIIWYLNNKSVGNNKFSIDAYKNWEHVSFVQSWGMDEPGFWNKGQGKLEIYVEDEKICEKYFLIGNAEIIQAIEKKTSTGQNNISYPPSLPEISKREIKIEPQDLRTLLSELDKFVGLNNVKQSLKDFVSYLEFQKERKRLGLKTEDSISLHCVFTGNPGTGKTAVARLIGKIFKAMGLLESGHVVEVDRTGLVGQYIGETAIKTDKVITNSLGGVLFIDEAYTLSKKSGGQDFGQEAIDILLKRMEDKAGEFAVICAGYPEEMRSFMDSNPGIKSRFNHFFVFDDYSPDELTEIFTRIIKREDYKISDDALFLIKKNFTELFRKRDKSFGNARLATKFFEESKIQHGKRFIQLDKKQKTKEALTTILKEDVEKIISRFDERKIPIPIDEENLSKAISKLNSLIGIENVKKEVNELVKIARYFSSSGENLSEKYFSHFVFLGNPGTGKTTVARIISEIFSALGILHKGHLVETDRRGLVSGFIGQTAKQTSDLINEAVGGTLFIDEAYSLKKEEQKGDFGQEAIDTLIKRMEDDRGKFIVIAAGYTQEMKSFLESNPGLNSRFSKTILFEDYSPDELLQITNKEIIQRGYIIDDCCKEPLHKYFMEKYRNRDKNFGNARLVRNLVDSIINNYLLRVVENPETKKETETKTILIDDIRDLIALKTETKIVKIEGDSVLLDNYLHELQTLTGLESVKESVEKLINSLKVAKLRHQRGLSVINKSLHSVFLGKPGTGKTTVARLLSKIYKEMGILEKGHLVEVDRAALVAGFQGQTAIKTEKIIQQAMGGTLFIDEAYTLSKGSNDFGYEAIETLLKKMEDNVGKFVVIAAGYPEEMQSFINSNPGLQSRFSNFFYFEDYTPRQLLHIAAEVSMKNGYLLDEGALQYMLEIFSNLYNNRDKNFGNARTAKNILYESISNQEERISKLYDCSDEDLTTITIDDVAKIMR